MADDGGVRLAIRHGVISRCMVCLLYVVSDALLPDHNASGVALAPVHLPQQWQQVMLTAFTRWDAAHFLRVAKLGYVHESDFAFFPLLPLLLRKAAAVVHAATGASEDACMIAAGVMMSNLAFIIACVLVQRFLARQKSVPAATRRTALLFFCYNPAYVFFSGVYTESLYAMLAFPTIALATTSMSLGTNAAVSALAVLAGFARSNGFLNAVFPAVRAGRTLLLAAMSHERITLTSLASVSWDILMCVMLFVPYVVINRKGFLQFCVAAEGQQDFSAPEWCEAGLFPSIYSHVQLKYWGVGFLQYYQLKQIPNFALALPILYISGFTIYRRVRSMLTVDQKKKEDGDGDDRTASSERWTQLRKHLPRILNHPDLAHVCHLLLLTTVAILFVNIQISTRLLISSCPIISLGFAELWHSCSQPSRRWLLVYVVGYIVIGTMLHANFFPWT